MPQRKRSIKTLIREADKTIADNALKLKVIEMTITSLIRSVDRPRNMMRVS